SGAGRVLDDRAGARALLRPGRLPAARWPLVRVIFFAGGASNHRSWCGGDDLAGERDSMRVRRTWLGLALVALIVVWPGSRPAGGPGAGGGGGPPGGAASARARGPDPPRPPGAAPPPAPQRPHTRPPRRA